MNRKERRRLEKKSLNTAHDIDPTLLLNEALSAYRAGQLKPALLKCRDLLRAFLDHPGALNLSASIYMDLKDFTKCIECLKRLALRFPDDAQAHYNLGTAYAASGRLKDAASSQNRALELKPDYTDALYNLANLYRQTGKTDQSVSNYRRTLDLNAAYPGAATNLASALLELGRPAEALQACDAALNAFPGDRDAFAFKGIAAAENGDPDTAAAILSMDDLIRPRDFTPPSGFSDMAEFNQALAAHVLAHPTLTREPHNMATRQGQQTENMALEPKGPVARLEEMIIEAFDEYMAAIKTLCGHPYVPLIPELRKIDIWGTVLDRQGHQAAHMHRAAWVSGVYYVQLPDIMSTDNPGRTGWIEFGRPPDEFPCAAPHDVRIFEPKEGRMFMFPSYAYHRTIPFESSMQRISIAFDLLA